MGKKQSLGLFQSAFLLATTRLKDEAYAKRIMEWLEVRRTSGKPINIGQVYGTAERLLDLGLIDWRKAPHPTDQSKHSVILYQLTPAGITALETGERDELTVH